MSEAKRLIIIWMTHWVKSLSFVCWFEMGVMEGWDESFGSGRW